VIERIGGAEGGSEAARMRPAALPPPQRMLDKMRNRK